MLRHTLQKQNWNVNKTINPTFQILLLNLQKGSRDLRILKNLVFEDENPLYLPVYKEQVFKTEIFTDVWYKVYLDAILCFV